MALHDLSCPECGAVSEHLLGKDDRWVEVKCPECGTAMTRGNHKKYDGMRIHITGETVSGGCSYNYYDDGLDCQITSKQHRADEMKRQGVTEYAPDPVMKRHREEQSYIKRNSRPGDAQAVRAINKEKRAASKKRQRAAVDRAFDNAPLPSLNGLGD